MKKDAALKNLGEKSCEIKVDDVNANKINNGCALLKFISINIIAAICWLPPLISQLFSPRLF